MTSSFQFSIRNLLVIVAFVAVGITALFNANVWWGAALWMLVLFMAGSAILLVVYRRESDRAYWLGFLVFGALYLATILWSQVFPSGLVNRLAIAAYGVLPESRTMPDQSVAYTYELDPYEMPPPPPPGVARAVVARINPSYVPFENFAQVWQSLCLLVAAAVGGKAAQFIYRRQQPRGEP